jgi:hypothetical protein
MDGYGLNYYLKRILNPQPLAIKAPLEIRASPLAIKKILKDN